MWQCINCKNTLEERPNVCRRCGLVQAGIGTEDKYLILKQYCHALSLIMRSHDIDHYFIDACAGSGRVQAYGRDEYIDGSPLIMLKTRDYVQQKIRDKTKQKHVRCIFIEANEKTYKLLKEWTEGFPSREKVILGDCNKELPEVLDEIERERRKPFAFIYIDPFAMGDPIIKMETSLRVLERDFTELFLQLDAIGIARVFGWMEKENRDDPDQKLGVKRCEENLRAFLSDEVFEKLHSEWPRLQKGEKGREILKHYIQYVGRYFPRIKYTEIPIGSELPSYYLIFATRNEIGEKIMSDIIGRARREKHRGLGQYLQ